MLNLFSSSPWPPGMTLTLLQLSLRFMGLAYIPVFTKVYQRTLDWFPGFVFMLSSAMTVLGMIPIRCVYPSLSEASLHQQSFADVCTVM